MAFTPVQYSNPGNAFFDALRQSLQTGAQLSLVPGQKEHQRLANEKALAELPYAGPLSAANVMSKSAYAQWAPIQPLAQLLSNPRVWETLPKEQLAGMTNILSSALNNPAAYMQLMSGKGIPQMPGINMPQPQNISDALRANGMGGNFGNENGNVNQSQNINNPNPYQQQEGGIIPATEFNRNAPKFNLPGSSGGANPLAIADAQKAGLTTSATTEASGQQEMFKKMFEEAAQSGKSSQDVINNANKFLNAYQNLNKFERGPVFGNMHAFTDSAQKADSAANAMLADVTRAYQQGHITDADFKFFQPTKSGRFLNPKAAKESVDFIKSMQEREKEFLPFAISAQKKGLSPQETNAVWLKYISDRPIYNYEKEKVDKSNLNSWGDYLKPEKINETLSPESYSKKYTNDNSFTNKVSEQMNDRDIVHHDGVKFRRIGKGIWQVV